MPTLQPLLARVEHLAVAADVEHPQRVGRPGGVPLDDRMPAAALRAADLIANAERRVHPSQNP